jgi:hypothetical protein
MNQAQVTYTDSVAAALDQAGTKVVVFEPHSKCADVATCVIG